MLQQQQINVKDFKFADMTRKFDKLANVNINKLSVIGPSFFWSFLSMKDMA